MDPPENTDGHHGVEMQPFVRRDAPDAPETTETTTSSTQSTPCRPSGRSSRSPRPAPKQPKHGNDRPGSTTKARASAPTKPPTAPVSEGHALSSLNTISEMTGELPRKKALLLLLTTLLVGLLFMVLVKRDAVVIENDIEAGEIVETHHNDDNDEDSMNSSSSNAEEPSSSSVSSVSSESSASSVSPTHKMADYEGYQPKEMTSPSFFLPGTENAPRGTAAGGGYDYPITNHFQFRNPNLKEAGIWGFFDFDDPDPDWRGKLRPQPDFGSVEHRDVKGEDFPEGAWQKDEKYMRIFLEEAKKLVNRTIESIYAEYGVGVSPGSSTPLTDEQLVHREAFAPFRVIDDINEILGKAPPQWTTKKSLDGLARRLIHAIMTGDTFKLVLGGHSAAAGHGNAFNQSYIIKAGQVLEPVFAHLGVEFRSYNFAQGGMGTLQQAMAGMSLRGLETDMIMWDSGMTEKPPSFFIFFMKQALISGNRAPFLLGEGNSMVGLHTVAGADVGEPGHGWNGPITIDEKQAMEVPWAARYLNCDRGNPALCADHAYESGCWVEREDYTPKTPQNKQPGGQASWHPGNRVHKIRGRRIALFVLRGLAYALEKWEELTEKTGHPLPDEHWHVAEYYKAIQLKAPDVPGCLAENQFKIGQKRNRALRSREWNTEHERNNSAITRGRRLDGEQYWPSRICNIPLQGRSNWGPRINPMETSLLAIMKPNPMGDKDPNPNNAYLWPPVYSYPDLESPWETPPETEIDVQHIASARRLNGVRPKMHSTVNEGEISPYTNDTSWVVPGMDDSSKQFAANVTGRTLADEESKIIPGYGPTILWGRPGHCDGTSHNWCDRMESTKCLMGGTQDTRGMVCFDGLSGWVVFEVKGVKFGYIGARMEPWHNSQESHTTKGWTEVNNGGKGNYDKRNRILYEREQKEKALEGIERMEKRILEDINNEDNPGRRLGGGQSCGVVNDYTFEFAINGEITSWNKAQFCDHFTRLNYNLDVLTFMDDTTKTGDFELAMRMTNVGREGVMCISHLYWG